MWHPVMWNILIVFNWLWAELVRSEYVAKLLLNGRNTDESLHTLKDCYCLREDNPSSLPKNIRHDYDFDHISRQFRSTYMYTKIYSGFEY